MMQQTKQKRLHTENHERSGTATRVLTLVLAILMLLTLCACAKPQNDPQTDPTSPTKPGQEDETKTYKADIPAGTNYGNEPFTVYAYPKDVFVWKDYDWQNLGVQTSDTINDAVFSRSSQVEQELGIKIDVYNSQTYSNADELFKTIDAGDDTYDIANVALFNHVTLITKEALAELNTYGCIDLDAAWWDQNLLEDLSISDKNFCLAGDIGTMYKRSISAILFNKKMCTDLNLSDPYKKVEDHNWTLETMTDMASTAHGEVNGDDQRDENDQFGLIYFSAALCAIEIGCDVPFATKNSNDLPELTLNNERTINVLDAAADLLYDPQMSYNVYAHQQNEQTMYDIFMDNRALFYYGELHSAEDIRGMESDFGILPMPLYDTEQNEYRHSINPGVAAVIVIPKTNIDATRTSYCLDALGAASKNILTPAWYTKNLQGRVSRDEQSTASLDIILRTLSYDIGYLVSKEPNNILRDLCVKASVDFVSAYNGKAAKIEEDLNKLIDCIQNFY